MDQGTYSKRTSLLDRLPPDLEMMGRQGTEAAAAAGDAKTAIYETLAHAGVRGESADWVVRALHPAASEIRIAGMPDESSSYVVRPEFRVQTVLTAPDNVTSWDAFIFTAPGDVNVVYMATAESAPGNFDSATPPTGANFQILRTQQCSSTSAGSPYWGHVARNETAIATMTAVCPTTLPSGKPVAFRRSYAGLTTHLIASAVSNQGQVYAAQFPSRPISLGTGLLGTDNVRGPPLDAPPITTCPAGVYPSFGEGFDFAPMGVLYQAEMYQMILPTNETDMAATAPGYYTDAAREGCYVPLKLCGPTQPFARAVPQATAVILRNSTDDLSPNVQTQGALLTPGAGPVPSVYPFPTASPFTLPYANLTASGAIPMFTPTAHSNAVVSHTPSMSTIPWPFQMAAGYITGQPQAVGYPATVLAFDTGFDNTSNACVIYRGLQGGNGGFASSIQVKFMLGLEVIPSPAALDRVFVEKPAPYDPKAIELYYQMALLFADAYPASYNSLGDLWKKLKEAASFVWDKVVQPVGRVVLPIAAGAAADEFAPGSGAFASDAVRQLFGSGMRLTSGPPAPRLLAYPSAEFHGAIDSRAMPRGPSREVAEAYHLDAVARSDSRRLQAQRDMKKLGWVPTGPPRGKAPQKKLRASADATARGK